MFAQRDTEFLIYHSTKGDSCIGNKRSSEQFYTQHFHQLVAKVPLPFQVRFPILGKRTPYHHVYFFQYLAEIACGFHTTPVLVISSVEDHQWANNRIARLSFFSENQILAF